MANEPGHFGTIINSFAGALAAILVAGGAFYVLNPAPEAGSVALPAAGTAATTSLDVPAEGAELLLDITNTAHRVALTFENTGDYRIELRALTAAVDPYLALVAADGVTPISANDDAAGTLDAIIGVNVTEAGASYRADANAFGETQGPAMLRIVPGTIDMSDIPATGGASAFPSGEIAKLELGEGVDAQLGVSGAWYHFTPDQSGMHRISMRAADESFDTLAFLAPVLPGKTAPGVGVDIASLVSTFTSDDEDGLNPRFQRYLVKDADYYLFVKSFDDTSEGSIALMAEYVGDDARLVTSIPVEDPMGEMEEEEMDGVDEDDEDEVDEEIEAEDAAPSSGKN